MSTLTKAQLSHYLLARREPIAAGEATSDLHAALHAASAAFVRAQLSDPHTHVSHKRRALVLELQSPSCDAVDLLERLYALPESEGLAVVEGIRMERLNGRRARTFGLRFLLGHPQRTRLAATRRQRVRRLLKHLLGERTLSAVRRALAEATPERQRFLRRTVLRHAAGDVGELLRFLVGLPFQARDLHLGLRQRAQQDLSMARGFPRETLLGLRGTFHPKLKVKQARALAAPAATAQVDGPLTALHKAALAEGASTAHVEQLEQLLDAVERRSVAIRGSVAVVLDLSASMASSGERAQHPAGLGLALVRLLEARCAGVRVHTAGGADASQVSFPQPQGAADLALAVAEAARTEPDVIFVVTDGYENRRQGDVEQVAFGLKQLGLRSRVVQVVPRFGAEDLSTRRLGLSIPLLAVGHEDEHTELLAHACVARAAEPLTPRALADLASLWEGPQPA